MSHQSEPEHQALCRERNCFRVATQGGYCPTHFLKSQLKSFPRSGGSAKSDNEGLERRLNEAGPAKPPHRIQAGKTDWSKALAKADKAFSAFIRKRDSQDIGGVRYGKCITSGKLIKAFDGLFGGHCGHFVGRARWNTRFHPDNAFLQSASDNTSGFVMKSGKGDAIRLDFADAVLARIGQERYDEIRRLSQIPGKKPSILELQEIEKHFLAEAEKII